MNILVSGSEGFIASHLIPKLKELGNTVVGMDIKNGKKYDVRDISNCQRMVKGKDIVIHLAALTDVQQSIDEPLEYELSDTTAVTNMLMVSIIEQWKNDKNVRFIFASSAATDDPQSPYGVAKLCGEHWCDIFNKCYGLSTISLRFFNVYGKGADKGVISTWIKAIKNGERPIIYGGNQVRDFIYAKDVVDAIICAMDKQTHDVSGVFEVGTGTGTSMDGLFFAITKCMNIGLQPVLEPQRNGEIQESIAKDTEHTLDYLGFKAQYTLKQGLQEMLK
jgi:nucleoside-diphosphate-sugar epimerase